MSEFKPAFEFMLGHEDAARSGVVTRDEDGRTRFGICEKFHPHLPAEFWDASASSAALALSYAETIYRLDYWMALRLGEIVDQPVATKLFDMCVPMGRKEAAILAQRAANGLLLGSSRAPNIDGKMGPQTIAAINYCAPTNMLETLCNLSKIFFCEVAAKHPEKQKDLKGWIRRALSVPAQTAGATA